MSTKPRPQYACLHSIPQLEFQEPGANLPCWSASAVRETRALTAGKVMLDMAATAPAAHIILQNTFCSDCPGAGQRIGSPALAPLEKGHSAHQPHISQSKVNVHTMALTQSRTRPAAVFGTPGPAGWCSYSQWTASVNSTLLSNRKGKSKMSEK